MAEGFKAQRTLPLALSAELLQFAQRVYGNHNLSDNLAAAPHEQK